MRILYRFTSLSLLVGWLLAACSQAPAQVTSQVSPTAAVQTEVNRDEGISSAQPGCTVVSRQPTPDPTEAALIPPPAAGDWIKGAENASITMMEYSDFQ